MDALGVTGWPMMVLVQHTMPQLQLLLRNRGRYLWPRVEPLQRYAFSKVSDEAIREGEPSPIDRIIEQHGRARTARQAGRAPFQSEQERKRNYAFAIVNAQYLGDPDAQKPSDERALGQPYAGMAPETARGLLRAAHLGLLTDDVWIDELLPRLDRLEGTAAQPGT